MCMPVFIRDLYDAWKPVVGFEGSYEVSDEGQIRNAHGRPLKPYSTPDVYSRVTLYLRGEKQTLMVHLIVARAFLGRPPSAKHQVNHKDGDRANNALSNLEYVTPSENRRHSVGMIIARGETHNRAKLRPEQVTEMRRLRAEGWKIVPLARRFGVQATTVHNICERVTWKHLP